MPCMANADDFPTGWPLILEPAWQLTPPPIDLNVPLLGLGVRPGFNLTVVLTEQVALVPAEVEADAASATAPTMMTASTSGTNERLDTFIRSSFPSTYD